MTAPTGDGERPPAQGPPPGQPYHPPPYGYPQAPYQQPYQPPYQQPPWQNRGTNGLAIASMVVGILWLYWVGSILALIFGYIARGQIRRSGQSGDGMAIAGIVLGWVGIGTLALVVLLGIGVLA